MGFEIDSCVEAYDHSDEVSDAVTAWMKRMELFLGDVQQVLDASHLPPAAESKVKVLAAHLPAAMREFRSQVPTPEMIQVWVRSLSERRVEAAGRD